MYCRYPLFWKWDLEWLTLITGSISISTLAKPLESITLPISLGLLLSLCPWVHQPSQLSFWPLSAISSHFSALSHAAHSHPRAFADAVRSAWNALTPSLPTLLISQDPSFPGTLASSLHLLPFLSSCLVVYCWENPVGEHTLTWSIPSLFPEFGGLAHLCPSPSQVSPSFFCWIIVSTPCHLSIRIKALWLRAWLLNLSNSSSTPPY